MKKLSRDWGTGGTAKCSIPRPPCAVPGRSGSLRAQAVADYTGASHSVTSCNLRVPV